MKTEAFSKNFVKNKTSIFVDKGLILADEKSRSGTEIVKV